MNKAFPTTFKFCNEETFSDYSYDKLQDLRLEIRDEDPNYISQVNAAEYLKYLLDKYSITPPHLKFDNLHASETTRLVPAESFPRGIPMFIEKGRKYERTVITYRIPFDGNEELFRLSAENYESRYAFDYIDTYVDSGHICFDIIDYFNNLQRVKEISNNNLRLLASDYSKLVQKIEEYNYSLKWNAQSAVEEKKNKISSLTEILGVPIKKIPNVPEVFLLDENTRQIVIKPSFNENNQNLEYVLGDNIYFDILKKIHDIGKNFERYPSTHKEKQEEDLRDLIITFLQPHYELPITGETFNKSGKTDILIRYQNTNVFVAECKFWQGKEVFLKTITQLLNYLTWRDSKVAVIIFVKRKDFSSVIQTIKSVISEHENYVNYVDENDETWLNYDFHLNNDENRKVKLGVLLFNLEESN